MRVGDLVRAIPNEQLGIIVSDGPARRHDALVEVMWMGSGSHEWCMKSRLEVISASR